MEGEYNEFSVLRIYHFLLMGSSSLSVGKIQASPRFQTGDVMSPDYRSVPMDSNRNK